jgi:hypothetical protein
METEGYYKWYAPFQAWWNLCLDTDDKMLAEHMRNERDGAIKDMKEPLIIIRDKIDK